MFLRTVVIGSEPGKTPTRNFFSAPVQNVARLKEHSVKYFTVIETHENAKILNCLGLCILGPLELEVR